MTQVTYCDLRNEANQARQRWVNATLDLLSTLEAIDPELVKHGLGLVTGDQAREALAKYLTEPIPSLGGATCYDALASGGRARILQLFAAVAHGTYL